MNETVERSGGSMFVKCKICCLLSIHVTNAALLTWYSSYSLYLLLKKVLHFFLMVYGPKWCNGTSYHR